MVSFSNEPDLLTYLTYTAGQVAASKPIDQISLEKIPFEWSGHVTLINTTHIITYNTKLLAEIVFQGAPKHSHWRWNRLLTSLLRPRFKPLTSHKSRAVVFAWELQGCSQHHLWVGLLSLGMTVQVRWGSSTTGLDSPAASVVSCLSASWGGRGLKQSKKIFITFWSKLYNSLCTARIVFYFTPPC